MKRILAIKLADFGDALLTTPALRALRGGFPEAELDVLTTPQAAKVFEASGLVDRVHSMAVRSRDSRSTAPGRGTIGQIARLAARRYDAVALFHHLTTLGGALRQAALVLALRVPVRAGLAPFGSLKGAFLTHPALDSGFSSRHEVESFLAVAHALGAPPADRRLGFQIEPEADRMAVALIPSHWATLDAVRNPLEPQSSVVESAAEQSDSAAVFRPRIDGPVAIHAGGGDYSLARRWPAGGFAAVAADLVARGQPVVVVGQRGDAGDVVASGVAHLSAAGSLFADLTGRTDLSTLAAVLRRCSALVTNDSGVMHLATAVGTPVVAIFGPSNSVAWGPWHPGPGATPHRIVRLGLPCQPCFYVGLKLGAPDGCPTRDCLTWLPAAHVLDALQEVRVQSALATP
jgi:ADP-heptose:LPS heptosyltransferase